MYLYQVILNDDDEPPYRKIHQSMWHWLYHNVGQENNYWFWDESMRRIFFRNEEDKVKFILRWM